MIFDPPLLYFPAEAQAGSVFVRSSDYASYHNNTPYGGGTMDIYVRLDGVEDVNVSAGDFPECLRFYLQITQEQDGEDEVQVDESRVYLAEGVGMVKFATTETVFDVRGSVIERGYREAELISYDAPGGGGSSSGCFIDSLVGNLLHHHNHGKGLEMIGQMRSP